MIRMVTIGVYGFDGESFLQRLRHADTRLLLDVRQRRGVRGPEYAWANSLRLQAALAHTSPGARAVPPGLARRRGQYPREITPRYDRGFGRRLAGPCPGLPPARRSSGRLQ